MLFYYLLQTVWRWFGKRLELWILVRVSAYCNPVDYTASRSSYINTFLDLILSWWIRLVRRSKASIQCSSSFDGSWFCDIFGILYVTCCSCSKIYFINLPLFQQFYSIGCADVWNIFMWNWLICSFMHVQFHALSSDS